MVSMNGAKVVAHDRTSGTTYIQIPVELQVPITGGCSCKQCKENPTATPMWDTLVVPKAGHAWTVHMPNHKEFAEVLKRTYRALNNLHSKY
jgi:hypothetical protein